MVKICILENHEGYSDSKWSVDTFQYYSLKDDVIDCITFDEIEKLDDLYEKLKKYTKSTNLKIIDFYYTKDYVLQGIFVEGLKDSDDDINMLASQLTKETYVIGNMIIVKRDITIPTFNYVSVTIDDIITSIQRVFLHDAVAVTPSNINALEYIMYPIEKAINKSTFEQIRYHEFKFLDYVLTFYVDTKAEQTPENINKKCSIIYENLIYGDVYVSIADNTDGENTNNVDLSIDTFNMIYELCIRDARLTEPSVLTTLNIDKSNFIIKTNNDENGVNDENNEGSLNKCSFPYLAKQKNFYFALNEIYNQLKSRPKINVNNYFDGLKAKNNILNNIN